MSFVKTLKTAAAGRKKGRSKSTTKASVLKKERKDLQNMQQIFSLMRQHLAWVYIMQRFESQGVSSLKGKADKYVRNDCIIVQSIARQFKINQQDLRMDFQKYLLCKYMSATMRIYRVKLRSLSLFFYFLAYQNCHLFQNHAHCPFVFANS